MCRWRLPPLRPPHRDEPWYRLVLPLLQQLLQRCATQTWVVSVAPCNPAGGNACFACTLRALLAEVLAELASKVVHARVSAATNTHNVVQTHARTIQAGRTNNAWTLEDAKSANCSSVRSGCTQVCFDLGFLQCLHISSRGRRRILHSLPHAGRGRSTYLAALLWSEALLKLEDASERRRLRAPGALWPRTVRHRLQNPQSNPQVGRKRHRVPTNKTCSLVSMVFHGFRPWSMVSGHCPWFQAIVHGFRSCFFSRPPSGSYLALTSSMSCIFCRFDHLVPAPSLLPDRCVVVWWCGGVVVRCRTSTCRGLGQEVSRIMLSLSEDFELGETSWRKTPALIVDDDFVSSWDISKELACCCLTCCLCWNHGAREVDVGVNAK